MAADALDVLLIEDDPGDARRAEASLREARDRLREIDRDGPPLERVAIHHERSLSAGVDYVADHAADVVLLELSLPDSTGLDTLGSVLEVAGATPVVVLTGLDDRAVGVEAIRRGASDYLVKGEVDGAVLLCAIRDALEGARGPGGARDRGRLEALDELASISHDILHDVVTTPTRSELEQAVCDRLAGSEAYRFAWIGDVTRSTAGLTHRASAGERDCVDGDPVAAAAAADRPEARALETGETHVARGASDPEGQADGGRCSIAAIPIAYRSICYGVLVVYASSPTASAGDEVERLTRLGAFVGHALTAIERKNALVSDTAVHLGFRVDGALPMLVALSADADCTLRFEHVIRTDTGHLVYGHAEGLSREALRAVAERTAAIEDLRFLAGGGDHCDFEFSTEALDTLDVTLADHGGHVASAAVDDGAFRFLVEVPPGVDKRQIAELVEDTCEGATLCSHRTVEPSEPSVADSRSVFRDRLTEKQRVVLETAYRAGYFDWPRTTSGEEVAASLGISQPTFSEHFRAAERTFFDAVFGDEDTRRPPMSPWK